MSEIQASMVVQSTYPGSTVNFFYEKQNSSERERELERVCHMQQAWQYSTLSCHRPNHCWTTQNKSNYSFQHFILFFCLHINLFLFKFVRVKLDVGGKMWSVHTRVWVWSMKAYKCRINLTWLVVINWGGFCQDRSNHTDHRSERESGWTERIAWQ